MLTKSPGDRYGRAGHLCQDRHKNEAVEDDAYLLTVVRYIHRNSVKAGLCREPEDYRYSSFAQYVRAYLKRAPLLCEEALEMFSVQTDRPEYSKRPFRAVFYTLHTKNTFCAVLSLS